MVYLTRDEIVEIHDEILESTGGLPGILHPDNLLMLETQPGMSYGGQELYPTVFKKAAVYIRSISSGHTFNDANKRTGVATASFFLELNGYLLSPPENVGIESFILKVIKERQDIEKISQWLELYSISK